MAAAIVIAILLAACGRTGPDEVSAAQHPHSATPPRPPHPAIAEAREAQQKGDDGAYESALRRAAEVDDARARAEALALLGLHLKEKGRHAEAIPPLTEAADVNRALRPYLLGSLMEAQRRTDDFDRAAATAAAIVRDHPGSSAANSARIALPAIHARRGDTEAAQKSAAALGSVKIDELTEGEFVRTAGEMSGSALEPAATAIRMRILAEYPQARTFEAVYRALEAAPSRPLDRIDFNRGLDAAERLGRHNRYPQSLDLMARLAKNHPTRAADPKLRFVRVTALFNSRQYEEVAAQRVAENDPFYLPIELLRTRAVWRLNRNTEFRDRITSFIAKHPKTKEARSARVLLAKYYMTDEVNLGRAATHFSEAIAAGDIGNDGENIWTLGWVHTLARNDAKALEVFDDYLRRYPDADYTSNALFWAGKIEQRRGNMAGRDARFATLKSRLPYNYYSYRAREIQGDTNLPPSRIESGLSFPKGPGESIRNDPRLEVIDELDRLGLWAHAATELKPIVEESKDPFLAYRLADLYSRIGQPLRAIIVLQQHFRPVVRRGAPDVPQRFWETLYPLPYRAAIEREAKRQRVDPWLIAAIARQESGFESALVSNAGAVGVMQVMPAEAARIAERGGINRRISREEMFDPDTSIALGAAEIRQKLDSMKGEVIPALAAYNAGERPVGGWLAKHRSGDLDEFIESIPFNETRLYVKNVTRHRYEYERVHGSR
jgi:soluble lytic murein transglycosylase-like protein